MTANCIKTKNFSSTFAPTVGIFFKILSPGGGIFEQKSSGPEDIPEGMVTDTSQDDTCTRFLKLFLPGRYPIQLA